MRNLIALQEEGIAMMKGGERGWCKGCNHIRFTLLMWGWNWDQARDAAYDAVDVFLLRRLANG